MKRIIITGATSGIGRETALQYISDGWTVGVTGRRAELLKRLEVLAPGRVYTKVMDIWRASVSGIRRSMRRQNWTQHGPIQKASSAW